MIEKEENILRKYLSNDQIIVLMQNDILHLVAMAMRAYKNEDKLVESLALSGVGKQRELLCINCKEEPANRGLGEHKLVCSKCWNKQCD